MMTIGSITGTGDNMHAGQSGMNMQTDSVSKNIQNQIANAQKQLQELSSNENMTLEEKMKKRQEIQQEITSLNQQLRQHQIEQRKEQQSKGTSMDDMIAKNQSTGAAKSGSNGRGLSQASMQAMISADSSMKQAQVQGSVNTRMEGKARVLESEIKMDSSKGISTEKKEAELAEVEQKAVDATASQMRTLADANQTMDEAAKAEQGSSADEADTNNGGKMDKAAKDAQEMGNVSEESAVAETNANTCTHVDIRL